MTQKDLNKVRWKTQKCSSRDDCWCCLIVPEVEVLDEDGHEMYIAGSGMIPKENAEHIVEVHNFCLGDSI